MYMSYMRGIGGDGGYLLVELFFLSGSICLLGGLDDKRTYECNFGGIFYFTLFHFNIACLRVQHLS